MKWQASPPTRSGHVFVYARTGHAVATLGDERTFYHGGSRLFQFDQTGKFVKEIGQGVYAVNFAQQVRVDPQDNIWIVDAGSNQMVKFDADGRSSWCSAASPRTSRSGPARECRRRPLMRRFSPRVPAHRPRAAWRRWWRRQCRRPAGSGINGDGFNRPADVTWDRPATSTSPMALERTTASRISTRTAISSRPGAAPGPAQGQFNGVRGIASDAAGNIYVADAGNKRIQVFDGEGTFKSQITQHRFAAGDLHLRRVDAVSLQLQLERSREHGRRRDLQGAVDRPGGRQVRPGRQVAEGIRHGQRHRLPDRERSEGGEVWNWRAQKLTLKR